MIDLIRLGATTDHGGEVITASQTMRYATPDGAWPAWAIW
jgi:uncharacterized Zn-binding protein involved in type VI secretion